MVWLLILFQIILGFGKDDQEKRKEIPVPGGKIHDFFKKWGDAEPPFFKIGEGVVVLQFCMMRNDTGMRVRIMEGL